MKKIALLLLVLITLTTACKKDEETVKFDWRNMRDRIDTPIIKIMNPKLKQFP